MSITNIRNERRDITIDLTNIKGLIREYYEHQYAIIISNLLVKWANTLKTTNCQNSFEKKQNI